MLKKPNNYDEVVVNEDFERIELGGHKGIILKVQEYTSEVSGNTSLKVCVDTSIDDKQPNYFKKQYDNNTLSERKWSNSAIKYVSLKEDENCVKMLKSFITAVENSNDGFVYDWNKEVNQLEGKKVGLMFGLEEFQDNEGKIKTTSKLVQFRSIDKVDNTKIPKVKLLSGEMVDYEEYKNRKNANKVETNNVTTITDDMLPFDL